MTVETGQNINPARDAALLLRKSAIISSGAAGAGRSATGVSFHTPATCRYGSTVGASVKQWQGASLQSGCWLHPLEALANY
jgi:hypothetical protein